MRIRPGTFALIASTILAGCQSASQRDVVDRCCDTNLPSIAAETRPSPYVSPWLSPDARAAGPDFTFQDQNSRSVRLRDFHGAPIALSFGYTRCQNQRKCPAVARSLGELQAELRTRPVTPRPLIALVTYDPEYDRPEVLKSFAEDHGIDPNSGAVLLRPTPEQTGDLFRALNVAVNYRDGLVNVHGIQLMLLDKQGRVARTYHSLMWDNSAVVKDLARLAAE